MLQKTKGIVLRSVKYGETSLIVTFFTEHYGIESYMVKGVRQQKASASRVGLLQPATLLELVVYHQPQKTLQHLREFQAAIIYGSIQQDVVKNSVALFSIEVLLRLLPEHAPLPELFDFAFDYFTTLDNAPGTAIANFPLYFIIMCSHKLGYELKGGYTTETPHLNLKEGGFTGHPPAYPPFIVESEGRILEQLLHAPDLSAFTGIALNGALRTRLLEWYISFLQQHSQHMGNIRSLSILQAVLHD